jgi:aldehyde dehydrogenase (NAD+)
MKTAHCFVGGAPAGGGNTLSVRSPFDQRLVGTVALCGRADAEAAIQSCRSVTGPPTRFERSTILERTRAAVESRREEFAQLIMSESGLCLKETRYEVGRALDVLCGMMGRFFRATSRLKAKRGRSSPSASPCTAPSASRLSTIP